MSITSNDINLKGQNRTSTVSQKNDAEHHGAWYLATNPKYYEPQRSNTFKFVVTGLQDKLKGSLSVNSYGIDHADEVLELSVKSSSVPHFTINKLEISRGNSKMYFAGKGEFGEGKLVVNDYIGAATKDMLLAWQRLAYNPETEKTGLASDYKIDATLYEFTPEYQVVRTWNMYGCWLKDLSEGDYDHDSNEVKTIDATIIYDKAIVDFSETIPDQD